MQQRVQQGLEDGARLPSLDMEKFRGENNALREEQHRLKKVCYKGLIILLVSHLSSKAHKKLTKVLRCQKSISLFFDGLFLG